MKTFNKNKTEKNCKREYVPPTIKESKIIFEIDSASSINGSIIIQPDRSHLWKYIPPTIEVIGVEMENGLAANSGFALPVKNNTPINETWDNADITPDNPIYW
ncbi:hypothetical protein [Elizabethkingia ursingii]|uniref:Uncharacterized protein n=1 Tax=Elizabethkingia ursingii TaxID=1756150 RepID=A0ABX3N6K3_9FLAO|nr:hypothetical protein [Elizabethkingia ursingii]OPB87004.1 hypothetical protein BB021_10855 [Elizabethkingia ursingii]